MGSYKTGHYQQNWSKIKSSLSLNKRQQSLIIGSMLGDGTMRIGKNAINANFKVEQGLKQEAYVYWKYRILHPFVYTEPKISYRYDSQGQRYPKSWWFRTIRCSLLTEIYNQFYTGEGYRTGRKIVPNNIVNFLDPLALSVWIMDDGSYNRGRIDISTYSFTLVEVKMLISAIFERYDIQMNMYKDRDKGYRIYANQDNTKSLIETISPFIIPSMRYKVGFVTP